jgi:3-oxoadipate enol-lactonase
MVNSRWIITLCLTWAVCVSASGRQPASSTQRLAVPGGEIAYDVTGSGPTIVLMHGAFMDRRSWDRQVPVLAKRFRVVRYDIRPFGESPRVDKPYSVADDLLRLLDHVGAPRAHLMGHSFGGNQALEFAVRHPDRVASLILVSASPPGFAAPEDERKQAASVFGAVKEGDDAIVRAWLALPLWSEVRSRPDIMRELDAMTRRSLHAFKMTAPPFAPPDAPAAIEGVKAPTLILAGDRETPGITQATKILGDRLPNAQTIIVPGADHALPLGWPDVFNAAVMKFLEGVR